MKKKEYITLPNPPRSQRIDSNNTAQYGGLMARNATVTNSTISGNRAFVGGGVRVFYGTLTLERSIVSGNSAYDSYSGPEIELYYGNGTVNIDQYSLVGHDGVLGTRFFTPSGSNTVPSQPLAAILAPLADNGGPTLTHALVPGSPAINAAPSDPATD